MWLGRSRGSSAGEGKEDPGSLANGYDVEGAGKGHPVRPCLEILLSSGIPGH